MYGAIYMTPQHWTLIDPDKQSVPEALEIARNANEAGTDAFLVGGSSPTCLININPLVTELKSHFLDKPVILFPSSHSQICPGADSCLFMSLLNSEDLNYIVSEQVKGAPLVEAYDINPIGTGYLIFDGGSRTSAAFAGCANPLPFNNPDLALSYAQTAQYFGMSHLYLEAGSGAKESVPSSIIQKIRARTNMKIIVGGGIRTTKAVLEKLRAGADIIVTGTINEKNRDKMREIIRSVKLFRR